MIPLLEEQEAELAEVKARLSPMDTAAKIEAYRRSKAKILKKYDYLRDTRFPGWADSLRLRCAG